MQPHLAIFDQKENDITSDPILIAFRQQINIPLNTHIEIYLNAIDKKIKSQTATFILNALERILSNSKLDRNFNLPNLIKQTENFLSQNYKLTNEWLSRKYCILGLIAEKLEKNYPKAKNYYEQSNQLGDSFALVNLGRLHEEGLSVPKDYQKAFNYYHEGSKLADDFALYYIANLYKLGLGVSQDYQLALIYYQEALSLGNSFAFHDLAYLYSHAHGVEQNYQKSNEYYEISAKMGRPLALSNLAVAIMHGHGFQKDLEKALSYNYEAAKCGSQGAYYNLGRWNISGTMRLDKEKSARSFRIANLICPEDESILSEIDKLSKENSPQAGVYYHIAIALNDKQLLQKAFKTNSDIVYSLLERDLSLGNELKNQAQQVIKEYLTEQDKANHLLRTKLCLAAFHNQEIETGFDYIQDNLNPKYLSAEDNFLIGLSLYSHQNDGIDSAYPYLQQAANLSNENAIRLLEQISNSRLGNGLVGDISPKIQKLIKESETFEQYQNAKKTKKRHPNPNKSEDENIRKKRIKYFYQFFNGVNTNNDKNLPADDCIKNIGFQK